MTRALGERTGPPGSAGNSGPLEPAGFLPEYPGYPGWRGLTMAADGLRLLQDLRRAPPGPPRQFQPRTVAAAQAWRWLIL